MTIRFYAVQHKANRGPNFNRGRETSNFMCKDLQLQDAMSCCGRFLVGSRWPAISSMFVLVFEPSSHITVLYTGARISTELTSCHRLYEESRNQSLLRPSNGSQICAAAYLLLRTLYPEFGLPVTSPLSRLGHDII